MVLETDITNSLNESMIGLVGKSDDVLQTLHRVIVHDVLELRAYFHAMAGIFEAIWPGVGYVLDPDEHRWQEMGFQDIGDPSARLISRVENFGVKYREQEGHDWIIVLKAKVLLEPVQQAQQP